VRKILIAVSLERARHQKRKPLTVACRSNEYTATGKKAKPKEHMGTETTATMQGI
jgi:hypothetical protein